MEVSLWDYVTKLIGVWGIAWREAAHFALSSGAGWLAYWWTSTILSQCSPGHTTSTKHLGVFSTHHFSLLVALSFSVLVHIAEDFFVRLF